MPELWSNDIDRKIKSGEVYPKSFVYLLKYSYKKMKKVLLIVLTLLLVGCSKEDCGVKKARIATHYQELIAHASDTWDGEPNYNQIQALEREMQKRIEQACD